VAGLWMQHAGHQAQSVTGSHRLCSDTAEQRNAGSALHTESMSEAFTV
jgi:hypothetical protein